MWSLWAFMQFIHFVMVQLAWQHLLVKDMAANSKGLQVNIMIHCQNCLDTACMMLGASPGS